MPPTTPLPFEVYILMSKHITNPFQPFTMNKHMITHKLASLLMTYSININQWEDEKYKWSCRTKSVVDIELELDFDGLLSCLLSRGLYIKHRKKNRKLLDALKQCVDTANYRNPLESEVMNMTFNNQWTEHSDYEQYNKYLDVIIDLSKKGMDLNCEYMSQLVEMYEHYYFDVYVAKCIKKTMTGHFPEALLCGLQKNMNYHIRRLMGDSYGDSGDGFKIIYSVELDDWCNLFAMRMSGLMKVIEVEYKMEFEGLMEELDLMLDFVRMKYQIMEFRLIDMFEAERIAFEEWEKKKL